MPSMSAIEFALRCIVVLAVIFGVSAGLSIVLGWLSDQLSGKDLDE